MATSTSVVAPAGSPGSPPGEPAAVAPANGPRGWGRASRGCPAPGSELRSRPRPGPALDEHPGDPSAGCRPPHLDEQRLRGVRRHDHQPGGGRLDSIDGDDGGGRHRGQHGARDVGRVGAGARPLRRSASAGLGHRRPVRPADHRGRAGADRSVWQQEPLGITLAQTGGRSSSRSSSSPCRLWSARSSRCWRSWISTWRKLAPRSAPAGSRSSSG